MEHRVITALKSGASRSHPSRKFQRVAISDAPIVVGSDILFFFGCITDMIWRTFYESWQWTRRCAPVCSVAPVSDILHFNLRICAVYFDSTGDVEYFYFQIEVVDTSCF